jgi:uncharacterized tellurite resistance protein B-like protein
VSDKPQPDKRKTTLVPSDRHPARDVPEPERIDYLTVVASMVFADKAADDAEIEHLRRMCRHMELSPAGTETVIDAARTPDATAIGDILDRLKTSDLRFSLMVDCIDIAFIDKQIVATEQAEIDSLAERLAVPTAQVALLKRYVETKMGEEGGNPEANEKATAALLSAGVPAAGLAVAAVAGAPLVAAAGVAAALGAGSYVSVRWLLRRARRRRTPPPG